MSTSNQKSELQDEVTLKTALDQAQMSYLKGCVEAFKEVKVPSVFPHCRDKALMHRSELESIIFQPVAGETP